MNAWRDKQTALGRSQVNVWLTPEERELSEQAVARHRAGEPPPPDTDELRQRIADLEVESEDRRLALQAGKKAEAELRAEIEKLQTAALAVEQAKKADEAAKVEARHYSALVRKYRRADSEAEDMRLQHFLAQATAALGAFCTIVLAGAWLWASQLPPPAPVLAEAPPQAAAAPDPRDGQIAELQAALAGLTEEHRFAQARATAAEAELEKANNALAAAELEAASRGGIDIHEFGRFRRGAPGTRDRERKPRGGESKPGGDGEEAGRPPKLVRQGAGLFATGVDRDDRRGRAALTLHLSTQTS